MPQKFSIWLFQLALPLAIIGLIVFGQTWEIVIEDGPNTRGFGYPKLMVLPALHTSMAYDFYFKNILINLSVYWATIAAFSYFIWRELNLKIPLIVKIPLWLIAGFVALGFYYFVQFPDNSLEWTIPYGYEVLDKSFYFIH